MSETIMLISAYSIIAPAILGAIFYSKLTKASRILAIFVFVTCILEVTIKIMANFGMNNMVFFHIYSFLEVGFITLIYYELSQNKVWRKLIFIVLFVFEGFSLLNLLFWEKLTNFNSLQRNIEMILLMLLFMLYCYKLIYENRTKSFLKNPYFILTGGLMIYFTGTIYLFSYGNVLQESDQNHYWIIHGLCNIFLNIIYTIVLWKTRIRS